MNDGKLYKHDSHQHKLRFHLKPPGSYICNGCELPGDLYPCFKCPNEDCFKKPFHLHQVCYKAKRELESQLPPFFECQFIYQERSVSDNGGDDHYCDACGMDIKGFMSYRCNETDNHHDMHPTCADLQENSTITTRKGILYELKDKVNSKCLHCGKRYPAEECMRFTGWKWVSKKRYWSFPLCSRKKCYHIKCMNEIENSLIGIVHGTR